MCDQKQAISILAEVYESCSRSFDKRISDAILYGSYARGDYHEDSDIDILLTVDTDAAELPGYRKAVAQICSDLSLKHDVMISATVKPLAEFYRHADVLPYYRNVLKEGIRYTDR